MCGMRIKNFSFGGEVTDNYFAMSDIDKDHGIKTGWNIVRGLVKGFFEPVNWFELEWGVGGSWYSSTLISTDIGTLGKSLGGVSISLNSSFRPWKYFEIKLINVLDLYIDNGSVSPYYYGAARLDFHPFIKEINIYLETGGIPWFYRDADINITSGFFIWTVGASVDISLPYTIEKGPISDQLATGPDDYEKIKDPVEELKRATHGDIIFLAKVGFVTNSEVIEKKSYKILDDIAEVLTKRWDMNIEIGVHIYFTGNHKAELEISTKRANSIIKYLRKKGIRKKRMTVIGFWGFYSYYSKISESRNLVQIRVLDK